MREFETSGLYAPDDPDAHDRLELLNFLRSRGIAVEQMVSADRDGRLLALAAEAVGAPEETLTVEEVAARCHTTVDRVLRIRLASGLSVDPDEDRLPAALVDDIAAFEAGAALFGEAATLSFTRVMGSAMARMAEAAVGLFMSELRPLGTTAERPVVVARAAADAMAALMGVSPVMEHLLRDHVRLATRRAATERAGEPDSRAVNVGVGFVDLVGSTQWAQNLALKDQALALSAFESAAWDIALRHDGRVVKLIGDEAMFIAPSGRDAAEIASELCHAVGAEDSLPLARGAAGFGTVASRDGDYFGTLVNLVARAVKVAEPGAVVVTEVVRDELARNGRELAELPARALRGIREPVRLFALS
ncbi:MAG TPA: adenylate cyclase regulatory domain-containing protein [Acidimicrobiales bacterium]|nr:adenylate cyclase regulatory domain-containing protein [Acidimicrobiales bacterium]